MRSVTLQATAIYFSQRFTCTATQWAFREDMLASFPGIPHFSFFGCVDKYTQVEEQQKKNREGLHGRIHHISDIEWT